MIKIIYINNFILPLIILVITFYGFIKKVNVYETFLEGCKDGFKIVIDIAPTIITMIFVITIFIKSNFIHYISKDIRIISPEIISMSLLRPISGSATLGLMEEIFLVYGPDSFNGFLASLLQGSTETTVYVVALYYGSIGIKNIKNTLKIGLIVDLFGILFAILLGFLFYY